MSQLRKAKREQAKIRISLAAPTGFGKTTSALMIAYGMCKDWDKIAVIDTENKSASFYANHTFPGGFKVGEFNTIQLSPPFTPEKYIESIKDCEDNGIEVIIIDSVTHVWIGQGGLIEFKDSLGGKFSDWAKVTPRYQAWLNSILHSKCHVITTNRKKQAYNITTENNKTKVEKAGLDDQIRDGYDYEMTIVFDITNDKFLAKAAKDRSGMFMALPEFVITPSVGEKIAEWCNSGDAPTVKTFDERAEDACLTLQLSTTIDELNANWRLIDADLHSSIKVVDTAKKLKAQFTTSHVQA